MTMDFVVTGDNQSHAVAGLVRSSTVKWIASAYTVFFSCFSVRTTAHTGRPIEGRHRLFFGLTTIMSSCYL